MFTLAKNIIKKQTERLAASQPKFVFTHVPKCAGSSLSVSLLNGIYPSLIKNSPLTTGIDIKLALQVSKLTGIKEQKIREINLASHLSSNKKVFVTGHCYASPSLVNEFNDEWKFITVLREPVDRFISEFVYNTYKTNTWKKNNLDISDYIAMDNKVGCGVTYARFFSGMDLEEILDYPNIAVERSVANLKNFYKVGFLNELDTWIEELNQEGGFKVKVHNTNSSPNKVVMSDILSDRNKLAEIRKLCSVDIDIYNQIKDHYHLKNK